jgi:signal transduction protein with GAF and PtsI domain
MWNKSCHATPPQVIIINNELINPTMTAMPRQHIYLMVLPDGHKTSRSSAVVF